MRYLLICLVLIGCSKEYDYYNPLDHGEPVVEPRERPIITFDNNGIRDNPFDSIGFMEKDPMVYYNAFIDYAQRNGYEIPSHNTPKVALVTTLGASTAGRADAKCSPDVDIKLNQDYWNAASVPTRLDIMFHELGHDIFNATHNNAGLMEPGKTYSSNQAFIEDLELFFNSELTTFQCN